MLHVAVVLRHDAQAAVFFITGAGGEAVVNFNLVRRHVRAGRGDHRLRLPEIFA